MLRCNRKQIIYYNMAKIYSKKTLVITKMKPKKETVSFLLNYSKALSILKLNNLSFEILAN
jgi:hypothetical protein